MKKHILVIDDEEPMRKLLSRILLRADYEVFLAENGKRALEVLENQPIDLIMLDMNMPEMDGITFLKQLKRKNITNIPVLMVSAAADTESRVQSYKLGVYDYIRKPEEMEVILKRVENGLKIGEMLHFNEFIKIELNIARKLQKYLYPEPLLEIGPVAIRIWSHLLSDIGGDLYDYECFDDGSVLFFVADVSGHSISAALYTAIVKMVFRNRLRQTRDPGELLTLVNRDLYGNIPVESFVTMFCARVDPARCALVFSNAGHPRPLLIHDGEYTELEEHDAFLGPIRGATYTSVETGFQAGSALLVFTDGVLDVVESSGEPVGSRILSDVLDRKQDTVLEKFKLLTDSVVSEDVQIKDDCTVLLLTLN